MIGTVNDRDAFFRKPDAKLSVHYGIGLDGNIRRWVQEGYIALQTVDVPINMQSISIMLEDNGNPNDSVRTDALYAAAAGLVADLCQR
jgi:N-acetyl-anhydromuramyl-L-alanine amidase AmpD